MPISIYNSLTRKKEFLEPIKPPQVNMYTCGVTVYDDCHIGHARSLYIFDVIRRYLKYRGFKVNFVRNITDIDDKIINKAKEERATFNEITRRYIDSYYRDINSLGIEKADFEPKATENIPEMIKHIQGLITKEYAYVVDGDVYFSVRKFPDYGKLSGQSIDQMLEAVRVEKDKNKKDPLDFALWKKSEEDEPGWESPWGKGRPGWHIECSVMSQKFLKTETLDIHAGGRDLIFPHHENEIAQTEALTEKPFAKYWIHHGLLTINGQKMAKSLGNFVTVKDFLDKYKNADFLKLFFLSALYSQPIDYNDKEIEAVRNSWKEVDDLEEIINNLPPKLLASQLPGKNFSEINEIKDRFIESMDNDFNMRGGSAAIFGLVSLATKQKENQGFLYSATIVLNELLGIFDLQKLGPKIQSVVINLPPVGLSLKVEMPIIKPKLDERDEARQERKYHLADEVRTQLEEMGIILKDAKDGKTTYHIQWEKFAKHIEEELLKLNPKDIPLRLSLSIIYGEYIGNKQKAIDLCEEILKEDANNISAKFNLAVYTNHLKGPNESLPIYEEAEELMGKQGLINTELFGKLNIFIGHDIKTLKKKEEGKARYEKAISILKPLADAGSKTSEFWLKDAEINLKKVTEEIEKEKEKIS